MSNQLRKEFGGTYEQLCRTIYRNKPNDYSGDAFEQLDAKNNVLFRFWRREFSTTAKKDVLLFIAPGGVKYAKSSAVVSFGNNGALILHLSNITDNVGAALAESFFPEGATLNWYGKRNAYLIVRRFSGNDKRTIDLHDSVFITKNIDVFNLLDEVNIWTAKPRP